MRELSILPFRGSEAVRAGLLTASQLRRAAWRRLFPDVYIAADAPLDHRLWCEAAVIASGLRSGVAVSGLSAAWLLGAAETRWERAGRRFAGLAVFEQAREAAVARSVAALGTERFAELLARGARQPLAATIAFALDETRDPDDDGGAPAPLAGRLTAREREIAIHVADGLTNRQVAEKLFISRRTVDAHLEHIFGKLGITSRVMLAIHAREQLAAADGGGSG